MAEVYRALHEALTRGETVALCVIVNSRGSTPRRVGAKMLVFADGRIVGTIGGGQLEHRVRQEALQALEDGRPRFLRYNMVDPERGDPGVCGGQLEVYVEPVGVEPKVVVIGAGHVGQAVAHLAKWLGWRVFVCDDRPEFCNPETVPGADGYFPVPMAALPQHLTIDRYTYLVLTTRGVPVDVEGLPALLETPAAYIGVIGSRRRWATTRQALLERGVSEAQLARVRSPIGLDIGAETPEEIAVSILAEIIRHYRQGQAAD